MKVVLPENHSEIKLWQAQEVSKILDREDIDQEEKGKRVICLFTGLSYNKIPFAVKNDLERAASVIEKALQTPATFVKKFKLNGVEYGFENDLNEMTAGQYTDLSQYQGDTENLHKCMAVLFRPIVKTDAFGNYKLAPYKGTHHAEDLKDMPMNIVKGAQGFFFEFAERITSQYPEIYKQTRTEESEKEVEERKSQNWYFEKHGWGATFVELMLWSGYKVEEITKMNVWHFHWFLMMFLDHRKVMSQKPNATQL